MPTFNTKFDLTIRDIELIEDALKLRERQISMDHLNAQPISDANRQTLSDIATLLGRLYNQKVFYRPNKNPDAPFVSG